MKNKIIYICLSFLVLSALIFFLFSENTTTPASKQKSVFQKVLNVINSEKIENDPPPISADNVASNSNIENADTYLPTDIPKLQEWLEKEAPKLDNLNNNTEETEIKLRALVQALNIEQKQYLVQASLDTKLPINQRLLSAYMNTLNDSDSSLDQLQEIAQRELPDVGEVRPHTEAEVRYGQEMAIRYMQVDELARRAKTDANAYNKLKLLSQSSELKQIRDYAARRLKDL